MSTYTIKSAKWANTEQDSVLAQTEEFGAVMIHEGSDPSLKETLLDWQTFGGVIAPYQ